ncbi:MAG TPA: biotin--protein ligase [Oleiagrimonas sp.]|nr:biotin--protein ligase [Oleiagrimonas sp.]
MHGEYKMPGGKLIVADVEVDAGRLSHVRISGDFFLEPDTALDVINLALTQLPADSDEDTLTVAVEKHLGDRVSMYGISARAVAVAVRRALEPQA